MKFFENLKIAAEKTANKVAKKTGEIVEDSKTKYSIFDLSNDVEKVYAEIGKEIYEAYKEDRNAADFIEEKCKAIDEIAAKIEELRSKLD